MKFSSAILILASMAAAAPLPQGGLLSGLSGLGGLGGLGSGLGGGGLGSGPIGSALEDPTGIVSTPLSHVLDGVMSALNGNFQFSDTRGDLQSVGSLGQLGQLGQLSQLGNALSTVPSGNVQASGSGSSSGSGASVSASGNAGSGGWSGATSAGGSGGSRGSGSSGGGLLSGLGGGSRGSGGGGLLSGLTGGGGLLSGLGGLGGLLGGGSPSDNTGNLGATASSLPFIGGLFQNSGSSSNTGTGSILGNLFRVGSSSNPSSAAASVKADGSASASDLSIKVSGFPQELSEQNLRNTISGLNLGLNDQQVASTIQLIQTLVAAYFTGNQIPTADTIKSVIPNAVPANLSQDQVNAINKAIYPTLNVVLRNPGILNDIQNTIGRVLTRGN